MAEERWRRPAEVLDIQPVDQAIWLPDGRILGEVQLMLSEETLERIRTGYMCVKCLEPFEVAWPERCNVCGAPIRTKQAEFFAREFDPRPVHIGPSTTLAEERAGMEERRRKQEEAKR